MNKRERLLARIIYILYLFSMTCCIYLFIFHVQLLLHSIIIVCDDTGSEHFFFKWKWFSDKETHVEVWIEFLLKLFQIIRWKMLARQCVWREHPHICLHGCEMQLTKYSAIIRINLSELKKILKEQSTKHGMPSVHIFEWLHQIIKKYIRERIAAATLCHLHDSFFQTIATIVWCTK